MANALWPIIWPESSTTLTEGADPLVIARAEQYAASSMRMLSLYRVGGESITVMPCSVGCAHPRFSAFRPILFDMLSAEHLKCWCKAGCACPSMPSINLTGPVGRIDEVVVNGEVVPATAYRVENGNILVRTDGGEWPSCSGEDFTVTYLNAYEVDDMGSYVAGILALEFFKSITNEKKCRLPSTVTSVTRNGVSMEMNTAMFPEGTTGITEVDAWLMQFNPHGLRTRPTVYSPDLKKHRQVTWSAP